MYKCKHHFNNLRADLQAAVLEFVGTAFFLLLGLGGIQASTGARLMSNNQASDVEQVLYISTCMGISLLVSAWLFFRVTGGLFNPNVSLALLLVGVMKPLRFFLFCIAQIVGAITASALIRVLTSMPLSVGTFLQSGTSVTKGIFIEMFITCALVLSVLMLAAEKHQATAFAPVRTLFVGTLRSLMFDDRLGLALPSSPAICNFAVYYTGASMNCARSFGPAVVGGFESDHWVYWVGPLLGSLLGAALYATMKHVQYWKLNPGQDATDPREAAQEIEEAQY
ncbi:hypothetical protein H0H87_011219 [Tephrocybe sp. NHM501043]|nr:hypothetical protein H0H87_011219 [Tephrocybe sp. NHM501043]